MSKMATLDIIIKNRDMADFVEKCELALERLPLKEKLSVVHQIMMVEGVRSDWSFEVSYDMVKRVNDDYLAWQDRYDN